MGFEKFTICINNRKILNGLFSSLELKDKSTEILRIIDKLEKIGKEAVIEELQKLNVENKSIEKIMNFIEIQGNTDEKLYGLDKLNIKDDIFQEGLKDLKEVIKYIRLFNVPDTNFKIDLTIARGLDYYTGTVYETFLDDYRKLGSVCSGGRYDNLAEYYTNRKLPGVGISIGLTRFFDQVYDLGLIKADKKSISEVLVVSMSENLEYATKVANVLRQNGINTQMYLENKKIKAKFKYADKLQVPYTIVLGEDEEKNNTVTLKDMQTGEQQQISLEEVIKIIK